MVYVYVAEKITVRADIVRKIWNQICEEIYKISKPKFDLNLNVTFYIL